MTRCRTDLLGLGRSHPSRELPGPDAFSALQLRPFEVPFSVTRRPVGSLRSLDMTFGTVERQM
jgi:hypothetical protein